MMEIPLKIEIDGPHDEYCGECCFKDADYFDRAGKCLLFNEVLKPEIKYGSVEAWERCRQCLVIK